MRWTGGRPWFTPLVALALVSLILTTAGCDRGEKRRSQPPPPPPPGAGLKGAPPPGAGLERVPMTPRGKIPGKGFRFAVMGGLHFSSRSADRARAELKVIRAYRPDFILFLGGTVDAMGEDAAAVAAQWQAFDALVKPLGVPVYDTFGWGEIPAILSPEALRAPFVARYKAPHYSFTHKGNHFIVLDSESKKASIDDEQLAFLKRELAATPAGGNTFVAVHDPLWVGEGAKVAAWMKRAHPLLDGRVQVVFGAKYQDFLQHQVGKVRYLASSSHATFHEVQALPHFLLVEVDGAKVAVHQVPLGPVNIERFVGHRRRISRAARDMDPGIKRRLLESRARKEILPREKIIAALGVKGAMSIADVGAGSGFFTFPMAAALGAGGKVHATTPDPEMLALLEERAAKSGGGKVEPVQIDPAGVDPFYGTRTFDLIFLCEVYQNLKRPERFFAGLRGSLKPGGRVAIIHFRNDADMGAFELGDFREAAHILSNMPADHPLVKRLGAALAARIRALPADKAVPAADRVPIITALNRVLDDRTYYHALVDYYAPTDSLWPSPQRRFLSVGKVKLASWLVTGLLDGGHLGPASKTRLGSRDRLALRRLNRLILTSQLNTTALNQLQGDRVYHERSTIISRMAAAGFKLARAHEMLPQYHFLEFTAAAARE